MQLKRLDVRRRRRVIVAAAVAATVGAWLPRHTRADNIILTAGGTQDYTPNQLITANGATQRLATGQPALSNSTEINFNLTATSIATPTQFLNTSTTLDTISGLAATTSLESVAKLNITAAGAYTFWFNCDDGGRLYIDGQLIINNEGPHGDTRLSKIVTLDGGLHDIRSFTVNNGSGGGMQLSYSGTDTTNARVLVPSSALFQAENTSANAISPAVSTSVRANNITPVTIGTAPDNITLPVGTATINLTGTNFAVAGLGTLSAPAGSGLAVTGAVGVTADTRRMLRFTSTALSGAGTYTFNTGLDLATGPITGGAGATIAKTGAGRLILDNFSSTGNDLAGATLDVQGGAVYALGSNIAGSTNPLGTATVNLSGGSLQLDVFGNGTANTAVTFANAITVAGTGGTIFALSGPATYNLTSTTPINIPAGATLTLNGFGGSNNVAGTTMVLAAPLTGSGALVKSTTPGSTAGINANVTGVAANRDVNTVILTGDSPGFSGPVTLATASATGFSGAVTISPSILEGRSATATAKPFGTGTITTQGGQLNLRGGLTTASPTYLFDNPVTVTGSSTFDTAQFTGTASGVPVAQLGALSIGTFTLTANTASSYRLAFNGTTTLTGNPTFNTNNATANSNPTSPSVVLGALNDGGTARTITKIGQGEIVLNQTATSYTGTFTISAGAIRATATNALGGGGTITPAASAGVVLEAVNNNRSYDIVANAYFGGNTTGLAGVTRTTGTPANGQVRLATGAVVVETAAGSNNAFASSGNLGTGSDLMFGLAADVTDSFTVSGSLSGITPWRGVSNDRTQRNLTGGTITAASNFALQGLNGNNLQFGAITLTPATPVTGHVQTGRLNLTSGTPVYNANLTFTIANGAAIQLTTNAMGTSATASSNARAVAYNGGTIDPGAAGSMSGNVFLETGSFLTLNDASNFGGVGNLSGEPGAILDASNATTFANATATQNPSLLPAGTIVRLGVNVTTLTGNTTNTLANANPAHVFEVRNGDRSNAVILSATTPPRAGFTSGLYTNDSAARIATGTVMIGAGGGTLAASTNGTFTVNAPITITGSSATSITFGSNLIIDPAVNGAVRNATVLLGGANVYNNGSGGLISQVNVRARSTVQGTPSGNGALPQGASVGLNLGGVFQVNGPAAGGTLQFGTLTPNGSIFYLNRNATPTAGLIANFNAPFSRAGAFGPESRGSVTFQLVSGQTLGTSTDKVTFSSAGNAPSLITVDAGGPQQINMMPPWMVATDQNTTNNLPSNATTYLTSSDPTGAGLVPVTYTAVPTSGGAGTEIADASAATTLTGNITVAALRTNANISGAFTINLTSGGLLMRGSAAAITISSAINFGGNEGIIGNVNSNQANIISGKISGTGGLTKFGINSLVLSNAANDFSGGVTIDEANLRPGAASTATTSPFGFSGGLFNVVTVNTAGVLDLNGIATTTIGGLQGAGHVSNSSATAVALTLSVATGSSLTFTGTVGGADSNFTVGAGAISLVKSGLGTQTLAGTLTHTGTTTVNAGTLRIDGYSTAASNYTINSGGTLAGSGIITGTVTVASGGNLAPGASPGILRTGSLTMNSGGNYLVDVNGTTAGTGYDQTEVIGTVSLGNANLVATLAYVPTVGDKIYIINNDGFDPISGIFNNQPEGSTVNLVSSADSQSYPFAISYLGEYFGSGTGTGNDVVLTAAPVPEPAALGVLGMAAIGLLTRRRKARKPD